MLCRGGNTAGWEDGILCRWRGTAARGATTVWRTSSFPPIRRQVITIWGLQCAYVFAFFRTNSLQCANFMQRRPLYIQSGSYLHRPSAPCGLLFWRRWHVAALRASTALCQWRNQLHCLPGEVPGLSALHRAPCQPACTRSSSFRVKTLVVALKEAGLSAEHHAGMMPGSLPCMASPGQPRL